MTTFKELGLNRETLKGLDDLGFVTPTPIQEKVIPFITNSKKDLIALAQTGTGKTAAFGLPILNEIKPNGRDLQAIILCPTRELCLQISEDIRSYTKYSKGIVTTAVYGGERIDFQIKALKRGTNIVVGTPGRVHDLIRRKVLKLQSIKWLVLDEADEMLDMGFKDDLDAILIETPEHRRTLLFSATMSKSVYSIAENYMKDVQEISAGEKNIGAENVTHEYYIVGARDRFDALQRILDCLPDVYGILFCRTRIETQVVADKLKQAGYNAEPLHGDISQNMRTKIMDRFKRKQIRLLVATDVAARGIDVNDLTHVINYNLPDQDEGYTHRSGRTGRAQKSGISISIILPRDASTIKRLEKNIGKSFELKKVPNTKEICEAQIDNFLVNLESTDIEKIKNETYFEELTEKLKKINKEDLINLFISHKFDSLMDSYKNTRDLNASARLSRERKKMGDTASLRINFGRKHGLDIKGFFALINSNKNLKGFEVGKINLMPEASIFSVEKRSADRVVRTLQGSSYKGRTIEISKTNASVGSFEKRGGRQNRGYRGNRRNKRR